MVRLTTTLMESSQERRSRWELLLAWGLAAGFLLSAFPALATDAQVPWECSRYSKEAQARCVQNFIELQREKIAKLEGELQAQQATANQLKEQADRQAAASADMQRQLAAPPVTVTPGPYAYPYPYTYWYPPVGFSLYLGRPWIYGPPYFYRPYPYWGPRYFGSYRGHWGRHR